MNIVNHLLGATRAAGMALLAVLAFWSSEGLGQTDHCHSLVIQGESTTLINPGLVRVRVYAMPEHPNDKVFHVFGNADAPLEIHADVAPNNPPGTGSTSQGLNAFPYTQDDSYCTVGLTAPTSNPPGFFGVPMLLPQGSAAAFDAIAPFFNSDTASSLVLDQAQTLGWGLAESSQQFAPNALPNGNGLVLLAQITLPAGSHIHGVLNFKVQPNGDPQEPTVSVNVPFDVPVIALGMSHRFFDPSTGNSCYAGCTYPIACNYDEDATEDDGSCEFANPLCETCSGETDGTGTVVPLDGDEDGVPDCEEIEGCTDATACNYNEEATDEDGSCETLDCTGVCGGNAVIDVCGVCDGQGATLDCGCSGIPEGDCDCNGSQLDALDICGGDCEEDADGDGICDDVDDCVGELDACGVCNGQGAIYDCGCADQPDSDCDCNGNQLDVLGICGGDCEADADGDGVCDDEDDCVGELDECGMCNGQGAIYECGCNDVPEGDCDCNGSQLDALGVCNGDCAADEDADGICDDVDDCVGELDACGVCNGQGAIYDCGCSGIPEGDCDCNGNQLDALGECGGDCEEDADGDGICDDVDVCVGNDADCEGCMYENACNYDPEATLEDGSCDFASCLGCMDEGACNYDPEATIGDASCVFEDACGVCGGPGAIYQCGCANIPEGDCDCNGNQVDALGVCGGDCEADENGNSICDTLEGCTDPSACNYEEGVLVNDGSCTYPDCAGVCGGNAVVDECGVCNGPGSTLACGCSDLPAGDCDCDGNQVDACGECGGSGHAGCTDPSACNYDAEACADDGSCLSLDCAGVCGGEAQPDVTGECGGDCVSDVNGNGVCDTDEPTGCTYDNACNYDALAVFDDGSCDFESCLGCVDSVACNYDPAATINDGSCVFEDACGVCDGPGAIYQCGCANIPAGDCDCNGNQVDAVGVCGGDCEADVDGDGVCDSEDLCIGGPDSDEDGICDGDDQWPDGLEDECGVWNGPGAIYACGCTPLPEGDCDCNGSQLDAVGECGGSCTEDVDGDGVCDDVDDCIGFVDALGVCGGDCMSDCNNNGICDEQEIEGCTYEGAINYNPIALIDDGMCEFACAGDLNGDGWIALADMLIFLTYYNGPCAAQ